MILENGTHYPLAPQAFAETAPQFWPSYFVPKLGMTLETAFASYGQLYRTQPWVYTAVKKVSSSIARLGVGVWEPTDTGQQLDEDSPFSRLMNNPCPVMPPYAFWEWTASTIEIYGETYWIKLREGRGNQISGFVPMHPSLTQIFRDIEGQEAFRFMGRPGEVFGPADVVSFRSFNPDNIMRGVSRLEPLRSTLMNEDSSRRAMAAMWKNGARPSGVITSERELGTDGRERLKMAFQSEHQGTGNHGRVIVLEDGVTYTPTQMDAEDMAYIESRKLNREEVAAVMDLPPTAIQILDHATFSNVTENMRSLYRDSIAPRIEFIESVVNWHVGSDFNGCREMKFAVAEQLRGAFEQRAEALAKLVQAGIAKPSEARQFFDFNDAGPAADQLYANQALQPLGMPVGEQDAQLAIGAGDSIHVPSPDGTDGTDVPSPTVEKYMRDIGSLVGRGKNLQDAARHVIDKTHDTEGVREACELLLGRRI